MQISEWKQFNSLIMQAVIVEFLSFYGAQYLEFLNFLTSLVFISYKRISYKKTYVDNV